MNISTPKLRRHVKGYYFVHWGGKSHGLGRDKAEAQRRYHDELRKWMTWVERRPQRMAMKRLQSVDSGRRTFADVMKGFLESKHAEGGTDLERYYQKHLIRFAMAFGDAPIQGIRPKHALALRDDMLNRGYAPKTIRHDITALQTLLTWAATMDYCDTVSLKGVKRPSLGPPPDKSLPFDAVRDMMRAADDKLRPWIALNYLCFMRPSEVVRVVRRQGEWTEPGVYRIPGKMDHRATWPRHVCFSPSALHWLSLARPVWSRLDSYSGAVRRVCEHGPGRLRHSAATHLAKQGVDRQVVDLLLGHAPSRVSLTYSRIDFAPLLASCRLIAI